MRWVGSHVRLRLHTHTYGQLRPQECRVKCSRMPHALAHATGGPTHPTFNQSSLAVKDAYLGCGVTRPSAPDTHSMAVWRTIAMSPPPPLGCQVAWAAPPFLQGRACLWVSPPAPAPSLSCRPCLPHSGPSAMSWCFRQTSPLLSLSRCVTRPLLLVQVSVAVVWAAGCGQPASYVRPTTPPV